MKSKVRARLADFILHRLERTSWWNKVLLYVLLWCGTRLFRFAVTHASEGSDRLSAVHFADSERDFNISIRSFVEWLDKGN